jgi:Arc/MetJ-type ribon-helix-helix transcriptional regulator
MSDENKVNGRPVSDAEIESWSDAAASGYPTSKLRKRGRPRMGSEVAEVTTIRMEPELARSLDARVKQEHSTRSDVLRTALRSWLADGGQVAEHTRILVLSDLVSFSSPVEELSASVSQLPWDAPSPLVVMTKHHARVVIDRYCDGKVSRSDLSEWANLIESREDLEYEPTTAVDLAVFIEQAANPRLNPGALSKSWAAEWAERLHSA